MGTKIDDRRHQRRPGPSRTAYEGSAGRLRRRRRPGRRPRGRRRDRSPCRMADAATQTVTNCNDSGAGSLPQAVLNAGSGDTIAFAPSPPCSFRHPHAHDRHRPQHHHRRSRSRATSRQRVGPQDRVRRRTGRDGHRLRADDRERARRHRQLRHADLSDSILSGNGSPSGGASSTPGPWTSPAALCRKTASTPRAKEAVPSTTRAVRSPSPTAPCRTTPPRVAPTAGPSTTTADR